GPQKKPPRHPEPSISPTSRGIFRPGANRVRRLSSEVLRTGLIWRSKVLGSGGDRSFRHLLRRLQHAPRLDGMALAALGTSGNGKSLAAIGTSGAIRECVKRVTTLAAAPVRARQG